MKRIVIVLAAVALAGCSSFKLGSVMYCAFGEACSMQSLPTTGGTLAEKTKGTSL